MGRMNRNWRASRVVCLCSLLAASCALEQGAGEEAGQESQGESVGERSEALVITITTLAQLRAMSPTGDYVLGADIDASATASSPFVGIGSFATPFSGTFDGKTYKIKNLTVASNGWYTGMFKMVSGATLKNIHLTNVNVPNNFPFTGAIAGLMGNAVLSDSSIVGGTVKGTESTGGMVGSASASTLMNNTISGVNVTGTENVGGFVGNATSWTFLTLCTSTNGSVKGTTGTGGLLGEANNSNVSFGTATGLNVTGATNTGGLVGLSTGTVYGGSAGGTITGGTNTGGVVGVLTSGTLQSSSARVTVTGAANTGGLVGKMGGSQATRATLTQSYVDDKGTNNPSVVTGGTPTGMAVGLVEPFATLSQSYAIGKVTGASFTIGGFIGEVNAFGLVDAYTEPRARINEIYTKVEVTPTFDNGSAAVYAGGLIGKLRGGTITDINVAGSVKGRTYVGGAIGYAINSGNNVTKSSLRDILTRGEVTNVATANRSGLLGGESGTFVYCNYNYWDTTTDGGTAAPLPAGEDPSCQLGKTAAELKAPEKKYVDPSHPNGNYDIFSQGTLFTKANQAFYNNPDCVLGSGSDGDLGFSFCYGLHPDYIEPPTWQLNSASEYCTLLNIPNPNRQAKN